MIPPPGTEQLPLFAPSRSPLLTLDPNHRLVRLTEVLDWVELESLVQAVRRKKLKSRAGRRPHLRALIGAVVLMGTRRMTYREAEDQIRHYAPARYLCGLTDGTWSPDYTTIQDFTVLLGEDGLRLINEFVLKLAQEQGLLKLDVVIGDTTAQEAGMAYPTEVGLMSGFLRMVSKGLHRAGGALQQFGRSIRGRIAKGQRLARKYRFFCKGKKDERLKTGQRLLNLVNGIKGKLGKALTGAKRGEAHLRRYSKIARRKLQTLQTAMTRLSPQIQYWLKTGWVAKNKLVNLLMPDVCAIPRGKVGKDVEFGLKWGLTRFGGGFLWGSADPKRGNFSDKSHAVEAVEDCQRIFGKVPKAFAYDRGGYSRANVEKIAQLGVAQVGIAPYGQAPWAIPPAARDKLKRARVMVEGSIGALKSGRYTFNRPCVRSTSMMMALGQRSILGYNLGRLVTLLAARDNLALIA